jgi:hypothetical protein
MAEEAMDVGDPSMSPAATTASEDDDDPVVQEVG